MSQTPKVLLVEDDEQFANRLQRNLETDGFKVDVVPKGENAFDKLAQQYFDLVVTDIRMPGMSGIELIQKIKNGLADGVDASIPIVVLTSHTDVDTAVESMRGGASDFITKESEKSEIVVRLKKVLEQSRLLNENRLLRETLERTSEFRDLIGVSPAMRAIKNEIPTLAQTDGIVLVTGETGVGKDLVTRAIHRASARANGPFIDVNCAALPDDNLFHSEVFGHERGAFTDAKTLRKGKFELASGGTLFLDEITDLSSNSQSALLKAIETQRITRLGGMREIDVNCRIICASNRDLKESVSAKEFRLDLYYRINVLPIPIPPLRDRPEDIEPLVTFYIDDFCEKYRRPTRIITSRAMELLKGYNWPGNIRELRNILERLVIRGVQPEITSEEIRECGIGESAGLNDLNLQIPDEGIQLEEVNKRLVIAALEKANWQQKKAAQLLGITVDQMNSRVRKYNLKHASWKVHK